MQWCCLQYLLVQYYQTRARYHQLLDRPVLPACTGKAGPRSRRSRRQQGGRNSPKQPHQSIQESGFAMGTPRQALVQPGWPPACHPQPPTPTDNKFCTATLQPNLLCTLHHSHNPAQCPLQHSLSGNSCHSLPWSTQDLCHIPPHSINCSCYGHTT